MSPHRPARAVRLWRQPVCRRFPAKALRHIRYIFAGSAVRDKSALIRSTGVRSPPAPPAERPANANPAPDTGAISVPSTGNWHTKIVYGVRARLTALFAESGQIERLRKTLCARPVCGLPVSHGAATIPNPYLQRPKGASGLRRFRVRGEPGVAGSSAIGSGPC
jgi:hypothetical protein